MYNPNDGNTPYDENGVCRICGRNFDGPKLDRCNCPVCDECGEVGDPDCVEDHGLIVAVRYYPTTEATVVISNEGLGV